MLFWKEKKKEAIILAYTPFMKMESFKKKEK
jgi:hypothetical protein